MVQQHIFSRLQSCWWIPSMKVRKSKISWAKHAFSFSWWHKLIGKLGPLMAMLHLQLSYLPRRRFFPTSLCLSGQPRSKLTLSPWWSILHPMIMYMKQVWCALTMITLLIFCLQQHEFSSLRGASRSSLVIPSGRNHHHLISLPRQFSARQVKK